MKDVLAKIPRHVTFIMDGNGRWAESHGKPRIYGHYEGVERVRDVMRACVEAGVQYASFFAFSEENWNRPSSEVEALMELMADAMRRELPTLMENGVRFLVVGDFSKLSPELSGGIAELTRATEGNGALTMIVFLSYSGRWDIRQAARRMALEGGEDIEPYLATAGIPDPDLMIRTSGEKRISNYMLWQLSYTEFIFTDTLWPDFRKEQFLQALEEYAARDRRFGKIK